MKKLTKMISGLSAAAMLAVCSVPAFAAESQNPADDLTSEYPAPVEIDPADPNYPILTMLEKVKTSGREPIRFAEYKANDENGDVVKQWKYIPDEGVTVRSQYTNRKKQQYDILAFYKPGFVIVNPYKACCYLQVTQKDLISGFNNGTYFVLGDYLAEGCQSVYLNSNHEWIEDVTAYQNSGNHDIFTVNYILDENAAVIVNILASGLDHNPEQISKNEWIIPTEIPTETGSIPVTEILPGAYAHCYRNASEDSTQVMYLDPFSEDEPVSLVTEVKFGNGDITDNGEFSVADAVYGARMIAEDKTLQVTDAGREAADMDASGKVDAKDLTLMLDILATYSNEEAATE